MRAAAVGFALLLAAPAAATVRIEARSATDLRRPDGRTALSVELENDGPELEALLVVDQPGLEQERRVELPVRLAPGARRRFLLAHDGRPGGEELRVRLRRGREELAETLVRVRSAGWVPLFAGSIGPQPSWLWAKRRDGAGTTEIDPSALPHDARSWPDLDLVVWPAPRAADLDAPRAAALRRWVERGGLLLAGTAADQPRALDELGWPPAATGPEPWRPLGLGAVARAPLDLSLAAPPDESWWPPAPEAEPGGSVSLDEAPLLALVIGCVQATSSAPEPPRRAVLAVLAGWFLLAGPLEIWWQRRGLRRGRRPRHVLLRRVGLLVTATAAVLLLTGSLTSRDFRALRIDVVDVAEDGSGARGRSLVAWRQRAGGWIGLDAGDSGHAWPLPYDLEYSWSPHGRIGGLGGGSRLARAGTEPGALHRSSAVVAAPWSLVAWRVDFEPEAAWLDELRRGVLPEALGGRTPPNGWHVAGPAGDPAGPPCRPQRLERLDPVHAAACGAWSTAPGRAPLQHLLAGGQAAPPWPERAPALVLANLGSVGPELRVSGRALEVPAYTIVRVRLGEGASP